MNPTLSHSCFRETLSGISTVVISQLVRLRGDLAQLELMLNMDIIFIGEIVKGYEAIASAPKLPILSNTRWLTLIDGLIINGQSLTKGAHRHVTVFKLSELRLT